MKDYKKIILNNLLDKYEKSSLYHGDNKVNVSISMSITKKIIPDYFNEWDYTLKKDINEQALNLQEEGLVKVQWKKFQEGNIIDKIMLNIDSLDNAYKILKRQPKGLLENKALDILMLYSNREDWLGNFVRDMTDKLEQKQSIIFCRIRQKIQLHIHIQIKILNLLMLDLQYPIIKGYPI